jgi:hypothetical protein
MPVHIVGHIAKRMHAGKTDGEKTELYAGLYSLRGLCDESGIVAGRAGCYLQSTPSTPACPRRWRDTQDRF